MDAIVEKISAPRVKYNAACIGPKEHERAEYIAVRDRYFAALDRCDADEAARQHAILSTFELEEKWTEESLNLVMTAGKTDIVDKYFKGSSYTAAWYLGLKGAGTIAAGDTLASHAGWSELTPYAGNRPAITWGSTSAGSNTASAVSIAITGTATVAGAFLATVNTGTSGVLYSASDFAVARGVANGDTLNVTPTVSVS